MQSIAIIIPHFGKFNNYFPLWLESCAWNSSIDWIIFTDDKRKFEFPVNVRVHYTSFDETRQLYQSFYEFPISLTKPYQICEFRVAFGEIYHQYLSNYKFWGYCDTDLLWGNIRQHLPDSILLEYSKISWRGHLTLYRNEERINRLYRTAVDGYDYFKVALGNNTGYPTAFDEGMINCIFEKNAEPVYKSLLFADLRIRSNNFHLLHFSGKDEYKNKAQVFIWYKGNLFRWYVGDGGLVREDFCYIHFLKRDMFLKPNLDTSQPVFIVPNQFINCNKSVDLAFVKHINRPRIYWTYIFSRITFQYLQQKLRYLNSKRRFKKKYNNLPVCKVEVCLP